MNDLQNAAANTVSVVVLIPVVLIGLALVGLLIGLLIWAWKAGLILFGLAALTTVVEHVRDPETREKRERKKRERTQTPEERERIDATITRAEERAAQRGWR